MLPFPCTLDGDSRGRIAILVNSDLFPQIEDKTYRWVSDINRDGFEVVLFEATFATEQELRSALHAAWQSPQGLCGCILVGDFPVPWFSLLNDDGEVESEFPSDIYYADLDGEFIDEDENGLFEDHLDAEGDTRPDIWIGRLTASPLSGDEAELVNRYLDRNHLFRAGLLDVPRRALMFMDDDWVVYRDGEFESVNGIYDSTNIDLITDYDRTNAEQYKWRIRDGYEWVHVMVHSSSKLHTFKYRGHWSHFLADELASWAANGTFYNLFACSNARYVEPNYMGGIYMFSENTMGLCAVGCTRTGALTSPHDFYHKMGEGACMGEAFRFWFSERYPHDKGKRGWDYGLTLLGDPSLAPLDTKPPAAPEGFYCEDDPPNRGFTMTWEAPHADDLAGYRLHYDTKWDFPPFDGQGLGIGHSPVDIGSATSFTIKYVDLTGDTDLYFAVTSYDAKGNESYYSEAAAVLRRTIPPLHTPRITWAWRDASARLSYEGGGSFSLYARGEDDEDAVGSLHLELFVNSSPTGLMLLDDGLGGDDTPNDGIYTTSIELPPFAAPSGRYLLSIVATDCDGMTSNEWPYLTVSEASNAGLGRGVAGRAPHPRSSSTRADGNGPQILAGVMNWVADEADPYAEILLQVCHPESPDKIETVELYYASAPTGLLLTEYDEAGDNMAYFSAEVHASEVDLVPGSYIVEAVATDSDGNASDLFPYIWVE